MILPMLRHFNPRTNCACIRHTNCKRLSRNCQGEFYVNVSHGMRTSMHGGDEHQSMPPRNTTPGDASKDICSVHLTLQVNAAELSRSWHPSLMDSIPFEICAIRRASKSTANGPPPLHIYQRQTFAFPESFWRCH